MRTIPHRAGMWKRKAQFLISSRFQATERHHPRIVVSTTRRVMDVPVASNDCCCGANGGLNALSECRATAASEERLSQCCCNVGRCSSHSLQFAKCPPVFALSSNALACFNLNSARTTPFVASTTVRSIDEAISAQLGQSTRGLRIPNACSGETFRGSTRAPDLYQKHARLVLPSGFDHSRAGVHTSIGKLSFAESSLLQRASRKVREAVA